MRNLLVLIFLISSIVIVRADKHDKYSKKANAKESDKFETYNSDFR